MKIDLTNVFVLVAGLHAFARGDLQCHTCPDSSPGCTETTTDDCPGTDAQCLKFIDTVPGRCATADDNCASDASKCCSTDLCNTKPIQCYTCSGSDSTCASYGPAYCAAGVTQCLKFIDSVPGRCATTEDNCADDSKCCSTDLCNTKTVLTETTETNGTTGTTKTTPPVKGAAMPAGRLSVVAALLSVLLFCLGFF